jgi:hypothetical protein
MLDIVWRLSADAQDYLRGFPGERKATAGKLGKEKCGNLCDR